MMGLDKTEKSLLEINKDLEARVTLLENAIIGWWNAGNLEEDPEIVKGVINGTSK